MKLTTLFILGLIPGLVLMLGCGTAEKETKTETQTTNEIEENSEPVDSLVISLQGVEGKSVFEITKEQHQVESIGSTVGEFVHTIDSIEVGSDYGWMYSVNDSMGQVASDKYITNDSDIIKWHFRKY